MKISDNLKQKFNFLFVIYLIITIIVFLTSFISLFFIEKVKDIISVIPYDIILNNYFILTLGYLGINASEKFLTPSSQFNLTEEDFKEKNDTEEKYTKFKRKRFIIFVWFFYTIINFILVFKGKIIYPNLQIMNLGNHTYYFFSIIMIFFYVEQYKNVLLKVKSPLEKK